jgi:hypothetical protein
MGLRWFESRGRRLTQGYLDHMIELYLQKLLHRGVGYSNPAIGKRRWISALVYPIPHQLQSTKVLNTLTHGRMMPN